MIIQQNGEKYTAVIKCKGINYALSMAKVEDIIVLSGKGAENYMDIGGKKYPYNDRDTVWEEFERLTKKVEVREC